MSASRGAVRPRYGRISAAVSAFAITLVTLLAGVGVLPDGAAMAATAPTAEPAALLAGYTAAFRTPAQRLAGASSEGRSSGDGTALPASSGAGRRVVFDISDQRVWLVGADGVVQRSYLVSGSVTGNLRPGSYAVYSTSPRATGVDDSGVMQYFVRFAHGDHAAIGFHSIPTKDGRPLQTEAQLGTPQSHGCIRQALPDAQAMWAFAPVGTKVVVLA